MKIPLVLGSILLLAPAIAQAQFKSAPATVPPTLSLPKTSSQTPALDAFANAGQTIELRVRWVQIEPNVLATALPAWSQLGDALWSRIVSPRELQALTVLQATGASFVSDQQVKTTNNQIAKLSFSPFSRITLRSEMPLSDPGPIDDIVIPRTKPTFDAPQPYIPNLAKPQSKLPEMAPMPGISSKFNSPLVAPLPNPNTYVVPLKSRELTDMATRKFQLRPTINGEQIALELRNFDAAGVVARDAATATMKPGETVVFAVHSLMMLSAGRTVYGIERRTFLLVTPTLAAAAPTKP